MTRLSFSAFRWLCASSFLVVCSSGCSPSVGHLEKHLKAHAYVEALSAVAGDAAMEDELAALILVHSAAKTSESDNLVRALAAARSVGKRALKRLAKDQNPAVGRLASIQLKRTTRPKNDELNLYLSDSDADVRAAAVQIWWPHLERDDLEKLLLDIDPRVRSVAVRSLAGFAPDDEIGEILREVVRVDPSPRVRAEAARRGDRLGEDALLVLKAALEDESLGVQLAAIQGLAALGDKTSLEIVGDIASGVLSEQAVVAATEMARSNDPEGVKILQAALVYERPAIRAAALLRLERSGLEERDKLVRQALDDKTPTVKLLAANMLIHKIEFRETLIAALEEMFENKEMRSDEARDMLAVLGHKGALAAIEELFEEDIIGETLLKLVISRTSRAIGLRARFVELMGHQSQEIRVKAAIGVLATSR